MSERYNLELISRRRAFSFLGLAAALSVAVPATVLIATDAEARVGNPGSAVSVAGANRRDRRQDRRYKKTPTDDTNHDGTRRKKIRAFEGLPKGGPFRIECRCAMSASLAHSGHRLVAPPNVRFWPKGRVITQFERSGFVIRTSARSLMLRDRNALMRIMA